MLSTKPAILIIALSIMNLSACSSTPFNLSPTTEDAKQSIEQQRFIRAKAIILKLKSTNEAAALSLQKQLRSKEDSYVANAIKNCSHKEVSSKWHQALLCYESSLEASDSSKLSLAYQAFLGRYQTHIDDTKIQIAIMEANSLIKVLPLQKQLAGAAPAHKQSQRKFQKMRDEAKTIAKFLNLEAQRLDKGKKLARAETLYRKSYELNSDLTSAKKRADTIASLIKKSRAARQHTRSKQQRILWQKQFSQALEQRDFPRLLTLLDAKPRQSTPQTNELLKRFLKAQQQQVNSAKALGKKHYAKGDIDSALEAWSKGLEAKPDDKELKKNVQRAARFKEKMDKLSAPK